MNFDRFKEELPEPPIHRQPDTEPRLPEQSSGYNWLLAMDWIERTLEQQTKKDTK